jgi:hypothetical protein
MIAVKRRRVEVLHGNNLQSGWVKINSDAGFFPHSGLASIGLVARNDEEKVLLTA